MRPGLGIRGSGFDAPTFDRETKSEVLFNPQSNHVSLATKHYVQ
jgi:hypothetical protein